jgi:hypothetical protein
VVMKIAGIVVSLLVLALPGIALDAAAKTAAKTVAKKPVVAAKPASDDPDRGREYRSAFAGRAGGGGMAHHRRPGNGRAARPA